MFGFCFPCNAKKSFPLPIPLLPPSHSLLSLSSYPSPLCLVSGGQKKGKLPPPLLPRKEGRREEACSPCHPDSSSVSRTPSFLCFLLRFTLRVRMCDLARLCVVPYASLLFAVLNAHTFLSSPSYLFFFVCPLFAPLLLLRARSLVTGM